MKYEHGTLKEFLPHARCSVELREQLDLLADALEIKPSHLVRLCVEYVVNKAEFPGSRPGSEMDREDEDE